jgi:hypothetical protein
LKQASEPRREVLVRPYRAGDEERIVPAFNRIFAAVDPGFRRRSMAVWRWEFADNPSGFASFVAETDEGEIVGQYAALVQPVVLEGGRATFLHGVDSMTDPAFRRSLTKGGLFARLGNAFLDSHGGRAPERVPVIWGPPVPAAWRIGKTQIRYVLVRHQLKLVLEHGELRPDPRAERCDVRLEPLFPEDVGELFERCAPAFGAAVVRDRRRLDWRFCAHPEKSYRVLCARRAGALVGYAVTCRGSFDGEPDETIVCDWLVPADERGASAALCAALALEAAREGTRRVTAVLPETSHAWRVLQEAGFVARPTRYLLAARVYDERYRERWLYRSFYYTLGDMDLV